MLPDATIWTDQAKRIDKIFKIPNPHKDEIGKELLSMVLKQAKISKEEWEKI